MLINDVMTELADQLRSQHLVLDGTTETNVSAPDHNRLDVTGDIDIRARLAMDDWSSAASGIVTKGRNGTVQVSYQAWIFADGKFFLRVTEDGTTNVQATSTVAPNFVNGTTHWARWTLDVDNGAGGADFTFYTSEDGILWTQLGAVVTHGAPVTIFSGTAPLETGNVSGWWSGELFAIEVLDGIDGTPVATPRFDDGTEWQPGTTSTRDDQDNLWTLNGDAEIIESGIAGLRVYDWLVDNAQIPAAMIGFPETYEFDASFNRGVDRLQIPVHVLVGRITDRSSRDNMAAFVDGSGPASIKQRLEEGTYAAFNSIRVANVTFQTVTLAGVELLAATFNVDIWGSGD